MTTRRESAAKLRRHAETAITALDALGPMPKAFGHSLIRRPNPATVVWEDQAVLIGKTFFRAVWADAKAGDNVCLGYIEYEVSSSGKDPTDEMIDEYVTKINSRWAESIRVLQDA